MLSLLGTSKFQCARYLFFSQVRPHFAVITPKFKSYALAIVAFRVQYDQYFPSFSCFADLFCLQASEIIVKHEKRGKYWPYCER